MSESGDGVHDVVLPALSGEQLLGLAVDRLLAEVSAEFDGEQALARAGSVLLARERLSAVTLEAVRDVDRRELYALACTGSTRSWLRTQLGGDQGQLALAHRLTDHRRVGQGLADGQVSLRAAGQLCGALDRVPAQVPEPTLCAVLTDGIAGLLAQHTGQDLPDGAATAQALTVRSEVQAVTAACCADLTSTPAARLEPALLLLARHLAPGLLGVALTQLLDALLPDGIDAPDESDYYLHLQPLLDGDWDLRGLLDPETGTLLAREIDRREQAAQQAAAAAVAAEEAELAELADLAAPAADLDDDLHTVESTRLTSPDPHASTSDRLASAGQRRHDAFSQLLRDLTDVEPHTGQPAPVALLITAGIEAVEGRVGALPGTLHTPGQPVNLRPETLQRLGCYSELTAVLLDALGHPVGASSGRRSASRKERAALRAQWGPWCAIVGCTRTSTVPHHVEPWWLSRRTRLRDLVPLCEHDHRALHEHHRTLRLKDGRLIDALGWAREAAAG